MAFAFPPPSDFLADRSPRRSIGRGDHNLHRTVGIKNSGTAARRLAAPRVRNSHTALSMSSPQETAARLLNFPDVGDDAVDVLRFEMQQKRLRSLTSSVYAVLFNVGSQEEGIHSIELPAGSGYNTVLGFVTRSDCVRFCLVLEAQGFGTPVAAVVDMKDLVSFTSCDSKVSLLMVPPNTPVTPPSDNKAEVDYSPTEEYEAKKMSDLRAHPRYRFGGDSLLEQDDLKQMRASMERILDGGGDDLDDMKARLNNLI